jgi:hypothetical protein
MFIKNFDYLSPRVTFYHKGFLSHNSILSGILSIIAIIFILILAVYYLLEIIERKDPISYYIPTFIEDAGSFQLNKSSLFHFLTSVQNIQGNNSHDDFDLTIFNIIGTNVYLGNYFSIVKKNGLVKFDHWLYGYCNKEINTNGLDDLLHYDFFEKSICIQKFYNSTEKKYYQIGDPKFAWPEISHGTFNEENTLYNLIVQKCNNSILTNILGDGFQCKNDSEIESYFNSRYSRIFHFYFLNNYINILNYDSPIFNFFYRLETPLYKNQYSANDININPALIRTNDGLVWDKIKEKISYIFDRNDVYTSDNTDKDIYMAYCFFLKNTKEHYERTYKRIQDVISYIGGINQAITIGAICVNSFYNNFVILYDTELLLHSSINNEKKNYKKREKKIKIRIKDLENKNDKTKKILLDKNNFKSKESKESNERLKNNKSEYDFSKNSPNSISKSNNIFISNGESKKKKNINNNSIINDNINIDIYDNINDNINENPNNENSESLFTRKGFDNKGNKNFWDYLRFKMSCGKSKQYFRVYENFRIKILSEEHLIRNHLNIYNLLKINEKRGYRRENTYRLKDVMNLV